MPHPRQSLDGLDAGALLSLGLEGLDEGLWEAPTAGELDPLIPGYEVRRLIGRGGMGAVYEVLQAELQRPCALKLLPEQMSRKPGF
ncbi:MAG: hypothetical protein ACQKBY_00465, partial [Verrucomicrobiales bacterium]